MPQERIVGYDIPSSQTTVYLIHVLVCQEWIHGKIDDMQGRNKHGAVKALGITECAIDVLLNLRTDKQGKFEERAERAVGIAFPCYTVPICN